VSGISSIRAKVVAIGKIAHRGWRQCLTPIVSGAGVRHRLESR